MNITRHNFCDHFDDLKADIQKDTCRFIAIDTEFTGLSPTEEAREKYLGKSIVTKSTISNITSISYLIINLL
jgi:hypothetical protein